MTSTLGFAFTTTVRVVDRIHRRAANVWTPALPTVPTGLADAYCIVLGIPHLANRRSTLTRYAANFATGQLQLCPPTLTGHQNRRRSCRSAQCCTASRGHLDTTNIHPWWDVLHR
jgi:hypothetical protein